MQGTKYLLNRIAGLEGDKAVLLDELEKVTQELEEIKKEVQANGNDRKGTAINKAEGSIGPKAISNNS